MHQTQYGAQPKPFVVTASEAQALMDMSYVLDDLLEFRRRLSVRLLKGPTRQMPALSRDRNTPGWHDSRQTLLSRLLFNSTRFQHSR